MDGLRKFASACARKMLIYNDLRASRVQKFTRAKTRKNFLDNAAKLANFTARTQEITDQM